MMGLWPTSKAETQHGMGVTSCCFFFCFWSNTMDFFNLEVQIRNLEEGALQFAQRTLLPQEYYLTLVTCSATYWQSTPVHVAHQKPANARDKLKGLILQTAVSLQVWLLMVIPTNPSSKSIATSSKQNIPLDLFTCAQSPWNAKSKHNESRPSIIVAKTSRQTGATRLSINKRQHVPDPRWGQV